MGFNPLASMRFLVHAARIIIANLLLICRVLSAFVGELVEQFVQYGLGVVVDDSRRTVAGLVGGDGIELVKLPHAYW